MTTVAEVDVELVRWPAEEKRRQELREAAAPRLLLVEDGAPAPVITTTDEDWVRMSAADADIQARIAGLARRVGGDRDARPELDDDGLLRIGPDWVSLPPVEARLTGALLERFRLVVSRESLSRAGWPDGAPGRNALDVHMLRLRRRVAPLGLAIRTVRSRGYLLEPASTTP
jgi:DNA-binding response OmpR family regulator